MRELIIEAIRSLTYLMIRMPAIILEMLVKDYSSHRLKEMAVRLVLVGSLRGACIIILKLQKS